MPVGAAVCGQRGSIFVCARAQLQRAQPGFSTIEAFSGQRLPFFSNPELTYEGALLGVPAGLPYPANNALVIRKTAPMVAGFRGAAAASYAPQVAITEPSEGMRVFGAMNLLLSAEASDIDGSVVRVDFYANQARVGFATNRPFACSWTNTFDRDYALTAVAMDEQGAMSVSAPVRLKGGPTNDDFAGRFVLSGTNVSATSFTLLSSLESGEPVHGGVPGGHSVWWSWTAPEDGRWWWIHRAARSARC